MIKEVKQRKLLRGLINSETIASDPIVMFHTLVRLHLRRNIQILRPVLSMQSIEIIVYRIKRASMTRLDLKVFGKASIAGLESLSLSLVDGA